MKGCLELKERNRELRKGRDKQKDALFHDALNCYDCKCWWYMNKISIWLIDWMIQTRENQNETPGENLLRVSFCSKQIPHTLVWYQTSVFGVEAGDWKEENICSCGRRCEDNCKIHLTVGARVLVLFFWISIRSSGLSLRTRQWQFLIESGKCGCGKFTSIVLYWPDDLWRALFPTVKFCSVFVKLNICRLLHFL